MTLLKVSGVLKHEGENFTLTDISFKQRRLQKIAIAGETGSGKSTLLKIIAGLIQPDSGEVIFEKQLVKGPADTLVPGHPAICYLSQDFALPKFLRVEQVLEYANTRSAEEVSALYKICQIDHLLKRRTDQLSGGEKQRIAIARLLISSPRLLLLDEPFTNLDMVHKNTLKVVIDDLGRKLKISCILISHDPDDVLSWADKILVLKDGKLVQKGSPEKIYNQPVNEYAAGLFGKYTIVDSRHKLVLALDRQRKAHKNLILRPEQLIPVASRKKGIAAVVRDVYFFGSYYEAGVDCEGTVFIMRMYERSFEKGDRIFISVRVPKIQ